MQKETHLRRGEPNEKRFIYLAPEKRSVFLQAVRVNSSASGGENACCFQDLQQISAENTDPALSPTGSSWKKGVQPTGPATPSQSRPKDPRKAGQPHPWGLNLSWSQPYREPPLSWLQSLGQSKLKSPCDGPAEDRGQSVRLQTFPKEAIWSSK